jgi:hypothetical protein
VPETHWGATVLPSRPVLWVKRVGFSQQLLRGVPNNSGIKVL